MSVHPRPPHAGTNHKPSAHCKRDKQRMLSALAHVCSDERWDVSGRTQHAVVCEGRCVCSCDKSNARWIRELNHTCELQRSKLVAAARKKLLVTVVTA
jgi:hypothetical protein